MPRVAIAAVKACERSQEPCGRGDCERDLPINCVFDFDCNRFVFEFDFDRADFLVCRFSVCNILHVLN